MSNLYVRFERGRDEVIGPTLGPFDWIQVTYNTLVRAPDGELLAELGKDGDWHLNKDETTPIDSVERIAEPFSDFVIYHSDTGPQSL